jgi:glycosyltransferase involved in cell wall biosynthesis
MNAPLPLSVSIITLDEEANLPRCLQSVRGLASEIVVLDCGSTDKTGDIAKQFGAVFAVHEWQGHVAQKNLALERCTQPWALCVDADEVVSPELAGSIRTLFAAGEPKLDGYWVNRRTFYLGRWIWHAWYPEWRLRLVRNGKARWTGLDPHDYLEVTGETARLKGDLLHYSFRDLQDHLHRWIKYARIMADRDALNGREFRWYYLVFSPWFAFFKRLILKQAWRDGWRGWMISFASLTYVFAKYAFLLEKRLVAQATPKNNEPNVK